MRKYIVFYFKNLCINCDKLIFPDNHTCFLCDCSMHDKCLSKYKCNHCETEFDICKNCMDLFVCRFCKYQNKK